MDVNWLTPKAQARPAGATGMGSFAVAPISAGETIAAFGGWVVDEATLATLPAERVSRTMQIDDALYLAPSEAPEHGDFINHSCEPNCGLLGATVVVAMRDIAVGEELRFDYAMSDGSDYDEFDCACGSPLCRGSVSGNDWSRPELQARYAGYFSPYLVRRMAAAGAARRLTKSDVEELMSLIDVDPVAALQRALGKVLGRPHSSFETLVGLAPLDSAWRSGLVAGHALALDRLASHLNELRGF